MDWKACAVEDLKKYPLMRTAIRNSEDKLRTIEYALKSGRMSAKSSEYSEEKLISAIVEKEKLRQNVRVLKEFIRITDNALSTLPEREKLLIERVYTAQNPVAIESLRGVMHCETRNLYRIRDSALKHFTLAMYGCEKN